MASLATINAVDDVVIIMDPSTGDKATDDSLTQRVRSHLKSLHCADYVNTDSLGVLPSASYFYEHSAQIVRVRLNDVGQASYL